MNYKRLWDWIDERRPERHLLSACVLFGTIRITEWAMAFAAAHPERSGLELAAVIVAVTGPFTVLQRACIDFTFAPRDPK